MDPESVDPESVGKDKPNWAPPAATSGLRLILVRHGATDLTAGRRYSGRGEVALSEQGLAQAKAAARRVAEIVGPGQITALLTSPLTRCLQTAAAITEAVPEAKSHSEPDLIECDFGEWEGLTFGEVLERYPTEHATWLGSAGTAPPGGESFDQVGARVSRFVTRTRETHPEGIVIAVAHVSPIKLILREALAASDAFLYRCYLSPAGISVIDYYPDGGVAVRSVNETGHLTAWDLPSG